MICHQCSKIITTSPIECGCHSAWLCSDNCLDSHLMMEHQLKTNPGKHRDRHGVLSTSLEHEVGACCKGVVWHIDTKDPIPYRAMVEAADKVITAEIGCSHPFEVLRNTPDGLIACQRCHAKISTEEVEVPGIKNLPIWPRGKILEEIGLASIKQSVLELPASGQQELYEFMHNALNLRIR